MSVVGHNWSVFLGWRGGAGTGPNVGWATALWWPILPISFLVMVGMLLGIGMASVASLTMAVIIPISFIALYLADVPGYADTLAYIVGGLAAASAVIWALRPNIKRLFEGKERLVGPRARALERKQQRQNVNI
jgi:glycerol-3-phosphate acyltransferase PlsY